MIDFYHSNICTFKKGGIAVCHANIPLHVSIQIDLEFESCTLGDFNFMAQENSILETDRNTLNIYKVDYKSPDNREFSEKTNLT